MIMRKYKQIVILILVLIAIGSVLFFGCRYFIIQRVLDRHYFETLEVASQNGNYKLQIREWSALGGTGAEIYYVENRKIVKLGETHAKSGNYPFRSGDYVIDWTDEYICIKYQSGRNVETDDLSTWDVRTFFLPQVG